MIAVGVDIAEERKGLDLVAVDAGRQILASCGRLSIADVRRAVLELDPTVVCIDGPSAWSISGATRQAERHLGRLGISSFPTGPDPGDHPFYAWMRIGMRLFDELSDLYPLYRGGSAHRTAAEVFPAASAALLAGQLRPKDETKNEFRRRILGDWGLDATDKSHLPNIDRVDAALAAVTGLEGLAGRGSWVGDPAEGVILLPSPVPEIPLRAGRGVARGDRSSTRTVPVAGSRSCECGCGAHVRRRFLPGHDAKLKSALRRAAGAGDPQAADRLARLGWR